MIRCLVVCCQTVALFYYSYIDDIGLPTQALSIAIGLFAALALFGYFRAHRSGALSQLEFLVHLALEIVLLSLIFYLAGGAANPFVSYYLVPICIAATVLPGRYVISITVASILAYSLLLFFHVPIHALMPHDAHGSNLHLLGMWVTFVVSAALISFFVARMAATIELQREQMSVQREQQLEDDRLISIATLAASTAHELGTPLNSIHLLSQEIAETGSDPAQKQLAIQLHEQANICKKTLNKLVETANHNIQKTPQSVPAEDFFRHLFDRWQLLHPDVAVNTDFRALSTTAFIIVRSTLEPALFNLLNNAVQANSKTLEIQIQSGAEISLRIRDDGHGFAANIEERMGTPFNSDKDGGMGIGVYLAKGAVEQAGGTLDFVGWEQGTKTCVTLPLAENIGAK